MLNADAVPILVALRRRGIDAPVLAPSAIGGEDFVGQFEKEPEEAEQKGFFTEKVYAASPILFDSANADTLAFVDRFRRRYGRDPSWPAVQGYDSARLAVEAARHAGPTISNEPDAAASRRAVARDYVASLNSPATALQGVTGPLWFTADRRREQPVRVGLFHDGLFDSAPIQLVPVGKPSPDELASGEVIETLPGRFVRRQRVVYTGVFVNEVPAARPVSLGVQRRFLSLDEICAGGRSEQFRSDRHPLSRPGQRQFRSRQPIGNAHDAGRNRLPALECRHRAPERIRPQTIPVRIVRC